MKSWIALVSVFCAQTVEVDVDATSVDCFKSPGLPVCASYTPDESDIFRDLSKVCSSYPFLVPCNIFTNCENSDAYKSSPRPASVCNADDLLYTICIKDSISHSGCSAMRSLCATDSVVSYCGNRNDLKLPKSADANADLFAFCSGDQKDKLPDCATRCKLTAGKYKSECKYVKNMVAASKWSPEVASFAVMRTFCDANAFACPPASRSHPCIDDPTLPECSSYNHPAEYSLSDMRNLCKAMPFMVGCSIFTKCLADKVYEKTDVNGQVVPTIGDSSSFCDVESLILTTCVYDNMAGMEGCATFNSLCAFDLEHKTLGKSNVKFCQKPSESFLPTSKDAATLVWDMCHIPNHDMQSCHSCSFPSARGKFVTGCDPLLAYSQMCQEMPGMDQCGEYSKMCKDSKSFAEQRASDSNKNEQLFLCNDEEIESGPVMIMYFNSKRPFILLFDWWTPKTDLQYAIAIIIMLLGGVVFEFGQIWKAKFDAFWKEEHMRHRSLRAQRRRLDGHVPDNTVALFSQNIELPVLNYSFGPVLIDVLRGIIHFFLMGLSYVLMLGAMCFNTGVVCAVVGGFALGVVLFGRYRISFNKKNSCDSKAELMDEERIDCCGT